MISRSFWWPMPLKPALLSSTHSTSSTLGTTFTGAASRRHVGVRWIRSRTRRSTNSIRSSKVCIKERASPTSPGSVFWATMTGEASSSTTAGISRSPTPGLATAGSCRLPTTRRPSSTQTSASMWTTSSWTPTSSMPCHQRRTPTTTCAVERTTSPPPLVRQRMALSLWMRALAGSPRFGLSRSHGSRSSWDRVRRTGRLSSPTSPADMSRTSTSPCVIWGWICL
mmetsp:Transcript_15896/g.37536  ORF Transcript_15896/g.37536 Transcript_15896/m.37536 type:complete len:225 (+) Transcript_15896:832-1506(+)